MYDLLKRSVKSRWAHLYILQFNIARVRVNGHIIWRFSHIWKVSELGSRTKPEVVFGPIGSKNIITAVDVSCRRNRNECEISEFLRWKILPSHFERGLALPWFLHSALKRFLSLQLCSGLFLSISAQSFEGTTHIFFAAPSMGWQERSSWIVHF